MATFKNNLSNLQITNLKTDKKEHSLADGNGLWIVVDRNGNKRWISRITINKKRYQRGLGSFPKVSLTDARTINEEYQALAKKGIDPNTHKAEIQADKDTKIKLTFGFMFDEYFNYKQSSWSKGHIKRTFLMNRKYLQSLSNLSLYAIDDSMVLDILQEVHSQAPSTTKKVKELISGVFTYAKEKRIFKGTNPTVELRGNSLLKPPRSEHFKSLEPHLVGEFLYKLSMYQNQITSTFLYLTFITGLRANSALQLRWKWIDIDKKMISIPSAYMKTREKFRCPLTPLALAMILKLKGAHKEFVFPSPLNDNEPINNRTPLKALQTMMGDKVTVHGFRTLLNVTLTRTRRFPIEVIEAQLSHHFTNPIRLAYLGSLDYFDERLEMLNYYEQYGQEELARFKQANGLDQPDTVSRAFNF